MTIFSIADANVFYVSAERVFNPYLRKVPVIILSNNDGCAVARSNEAKALGIGMGDPYFKIAQLCEKNGVAVLSSNYVLYGDMSQRVMSVLAEYAPRQEIYSIDECFLDLTGIPGDLTDYCRRMREQVMRQTGIPVCVGIAKTKTLAKLANKIAKKSSKAGGVVDLSSRPELVDIALARVDVADVWGVGRRYAERLGAFGVRTAADLAGLESKWLVKEFGIVLARTAAELAGQAVHDLETQPEPRQTCTCSRSLGEPTDDIEVVAAAISEFAQTAAAKIRREGLVAGHMQVFATTNRFRQDVVSGTLSASAPLRPPTSDSVALTRTALAMTRSCRSYPPGCQWTKVGVLLTDLCRADRVMRDLFTVVDSRKSEALMKAVDAVNGRYGRHAIDLGVVDHGASWRMRREKLSPAWTTRWSELPQATI